MKIENIAVGAKLIAEMMKARFTDPRDPFKMLTLIVLFLLDEVPECDRESYRAALIQSLVKDDNKGTTH